MHVANLDEIQKVPAVADVNTQANQPLLKAPPDGERRPLQSQQQSLNAMKNSSSKSSSGSSSPLTSGSPSSKENSNSAITTARPNTRSTTAAAMAVVAEAGDAEFDLRNRSSFSSTTTDNSIKQQQQPKAVKRVKLKTVNIEDLPFSYTSALATMTANSSELDSKSSKLITSSMAIGGGYAHGMHMPDVDSNLAAELDLLYVPKNCAEQVELFAKYVWESGWKAMPHHALPHWLRDNDFLLKGHRPPLPSIKACFKSMFRIHTETGNIWTHLIGSISFIAVAVYFLSRPSIEIDLQEKFVFGAFFLGAIICLVCSTLFHTFCCFSQRVSKLFNKIDYCGISVLTMGSFVPWLYYAFYCEPIPKIAYLVLIAILGFACIVVSLWDKFSEPQFRAIRAGMFIALGLSGIIPAIHYILTVGSQKAFNVGALGWLILMAVLYIVGACLYAARIPERLFPGRFDIWFQSHQIFHIFVLVAAYVHYHGITKLASYRLTLGDCLTAHTESDFSFEF